MKLYEYTDEKSKHKTIIDDLEAHKLIRQHSANPFTKLINLDLKISNSIPVPGGKITRFNH